jgi:hypothetical protein
MIMMKRLVLPIIAALTVAMSVSSCRKELFFESMNTVWADFTITNDMWTVDNATDDLVASCEWNVLTPGVLKSGNVQAYLYEGVRQVPLPYVYPVEFTMSDGSVEIRPVNIRFDVEEGVITFIVTDCGEFLTQPAWLTTKRFRAVCTYPVIVHAD